LKSVAPTKTTTQQQQQLCFFYNTAEKVGTFQPWAALAGGWTVEKEGAAAPCALGPVPVAAPTSPCIARCPKDMPCFATYALGSAPTLPPHSKISGAAHVSSDFKTGCHRHISDDF